MRLAEYRWYAQRPIAPTYRRPDRRSFPKLVKGNCFNCGRRKRSHGPVCGVCRDMLDSPMQGHMPGAAGWGDRDGPVSVV